MTFKGMIQQFQILLLIRKLELDRTSDTVF